MSVTDVEPGVGQSVVWAAADTTILLYISRRDVP